MNEIGLIVKSASGLSAASTVKDQIYNRLKRKQLRLQKPRDTRALTPELFPYFSEDQTPAF